MFKTKLKLFIFLFLITTMDWNVKEGNIERNKFIADSIKNHIDYVTIGPGGDNTSPTVELEVLIPILLAYSEKEAPLHITSRRVMTGENAKMVTRLLAQSISNGKTPLNLEKYTVAAKTGTSNKHFTRGNDVYTSAIGYLPASNPKIAIYVVVDSPRTGADWGNTIASPVFARVAEEVGTILGIEFDKR